MRNRVRLLTSTLFATCLGLVTVAPGLALAAAPAPGASPSLATTARSAVRRLGLMAPEGNQTAPVTRGAAVAGVIAVLGLPTNTATMPTYTDVSTAASDFGAIEAAVQAGLMADWAPTSGTFDPSAPISRVRFAVLATNAMGLATKATGLIGDVTTFRQLKDLGAAGYDLGDANVALEEGVVPPIDSTRWAPRADMTQETLAVALYRLYLALDVPAAANITPAATNVLANATDGVTLSATNRLGQPLSAAALARYAPTYTVTGSNASSGQVAADAFSAVSPGPYTVTAELTGPFLKAPVLAEVRLQVYLPAPPAPTAPTRLTASEVPGGIALTWTGTGSTGDYQVYVAPGGSTAYTPVSQADGGTVAPSATSTTITGLTAGDTYTFEVASTGASGRLMSAPSVPVAFGATAAEQSLSGYASGTIAVNAVNPGAAASVTLTVPATTGTSVSLALYFFQNLLYSVPAGSTPATICANMPSSWTAWVACGSLTATSLTLVAPALGSVGNDMHIETADPSQISVNGVGGTATMANFTGGGVGADTITVGTQTYTGSGSPDAISADMYSSASSLATDLEGFYDVHLSGSTLTLTTKTPGTSGNTIALATDNPSDVVLNGIAQASTTLSGGTAGSLILSFSNAMNEATVTTANLSTALILSGELATFGSGATATWTNDRTLTIGFGAGATAALGEAVTFASSVTDAAGNPVTGSVPLALP